MNSKVIILFFISFWLSNPGKTEKWEIESQDLPSYPQRIIAPLHTQAVSVFLDHDENGDDQDSITADVDPQEFPEDIAHSEYYHVGPLSPHEEQDNDDQKSDLLNELQTSPSQEDLDNPEYPPQRFIGSERKEQESPLPGNGFDWEELTIIPVSDTCRILVITDLRIPLDQTIGNPEPLPTPRLWDTQIPFKGGS